MPPEGGGFEHRVAQGRSLGVHAAAYNSESDSKLVEVLLSIPENHFIELRENLGSPFRLTHLRNMGLAPQWYPPIHMSV